MKFNKIAVSAMAISAVVITAIVGVVGMKAVKAKDTEEELTTTVQVAKQDIEKTLSATGTIISAEQSTAFATTSGSYPVAEVYVKVGDVVKKGDKLYKLDMITMEDQLKFQNQALSIQNQQNALAAQSAAAALQNAQDSGAVSVNDANRSLAEAQQNQFVANRNVKSADDALGDARRAEDNAEKEYNNAKSEYERLKNTDGTAQEDLDKANDRVNQAKSSYDSATSARKSAEATLSQAKDAVNSANRSLDGANQAAGKAQTDANANIINQAQSVKSGELSAKASTLSNQQEIAKTKEELRKAIVYASQDGTVTNVNIKPGQSYSGTDAVVIDNVTNLKATADIDEAQIPNIAMGQKVRIKTDATGDEILTGTVTFVSPTATKNSNKTTENESTTASVSKSRATYRVDVTLDGTNEALRLGMTAKMTFVIASKNGALAVPSGDIKTDLDGSKYVVVQENGESYKNVKIETGISDDFFTEVTGGTLKEGDTIIENSSEGGNDAVLESMGADGGIYLD